MLAVYEVTFRLSTAKAVTIDAGTPRLLTIWKEMALYYEAISRQAHYPNLEASDNDMEEEYHVCSQE